jgi:GNAT superfamily N-acetyltransferase
MEIDARVSTVAVGDVVGLKRVEELARIIWPTCYAQILSAAQIDYMLDMMYAVERLVMEQRAGVQLVLIAAGAGGEACGFASWGGSAQARVCKLHKLYVVPMEWGRGLGGALLAHVTGSAVAEGYDAMRLNVNKYNQRAIAVYQRKGFVQVAAEVVPIGGGYVMDDYVMEKRLILSPLASPSSSPSSSSDEQIREVLRSTSTR